MAREHAPGRARVLAQEDGWPQPAPPRRAGWVSEQTRRLVRLFLCQRTEEQTMKRIRKLRVSPAMVVACLALLIGLGGTGYAALSLPANSVGTAQLKANAVTSLKVKNGSLLKADFKAGQ